MALTPKNAQDYTSRASRVMPASHVHWSRFPPPGCSPFNIFSSYAREVQVCQHVFSRVALLKVPYFPFCILDIFIDISSKKTPLKSEGRIPVSRESKIFFITYLERVNSGTTPCIVDFQKNRILLNRRYLKKVRMQRKSPSLNRTSNWNIVAY